MIYSDCHKYQRRQVSLVPGPVLNVGCKEDPAGLGRSFGAVNLDCEDFDIETKTSLYSIPNFVLGSALDLPFDDRHFGCVVLGEFLEHCPYQQGVKALQEAKRVLKDDGRIVLTFPMDYRPKHVQRPPHELRVYEHGITSWHQTVWTDELQAMLFSDTGLTVFGLKTRIRYPVCDWAGEECWGWGIELAIPCQEELE